MRRIFMSISVSSQEETHSPYHCPARTVCRPQVFNDQGLGERIHPTDGRCPHQAIVHFAWQVGQIASHGGRLVSCSSAKDTKWHEERGRRTGFLRGASCPAWIHVWHRAFCKRTQADCKPSAGAGRTILLPKALGCQDLRREGCCGTSLASA